MDTYPSKEHQFTSSNQPRNNGRKPSKLKAFLKDNNLSAIDIRLIASNLINLSYSEIETIADDHTKPILLCGAARAFLRDYKEGTTPTMQWLIDRAFGKPKESIEHTIDIIDKLTPEEVNHQFEEILKKYVEKSEKKE
jgi:hypothetical protein